MPPIVCGIVSMFLLVDVFNLKMNLQTHVLFLEQIFIFLYMEKKSHTTFSNYFILNVHTITSRWKNTLEPVFENMSFDERNTNDFMSN